MTEGTKLGEFNNVDEFNPAVKQAGLDVDDSSATKIGQVSDFEKSLIDDGLAADQSTKETVTESLESPAIDESQNEISTDDAVEAVSDDIEDDSADDFESQLDRLILDFADGDIIEGTIRSVEKSGVLVDIHYKSDGFVANNEFSHDSSVVPSDVVTPGDKIQVYIVKLETKEGYTVLSKKRADYELAWGTLAKMVKSKENIDVDVMSKVQGGLVAEYQGIKGFIPASQVQSESGELDEYLGRPMTVCVLQVDRRRRKVIFSHKQALGRADQPNFDELFADLEVGQVRKGRVTSVKDFGAFVDLGGVEGLVHISELSWSRVSHPSDVVSVGLETDVFVLGVDRETKRVSLGLKQLESDPWVEVSNRYTIGQVVSGEIVRIAPFGAFIKIANNLEGLIHISELSNDHIEQVEDIVTLGQILSARIIKLLPEEQRIGLSLKGVTEESHASDSAHSDSEST